MTFTAPQINLLAKRKKAFSHQTAVALKAKVWSGTVLVGYVVVLVLLIMVNIYFAERVKRTQTALDQANMSLTSNSVIIKQYEKVVSRAKTIEELFAQRRESIMLWQQLRSILPADTELTSFALEGGVLKVAIKAPHVLYANQVISMIENDVPSLGVNKTGVSVARSDDGSYVLNMELILESVEKSNKT